MVLVLDIPFLLLVFLDISIAPQQSINSPMSYVPMPDDPIVRETPTVLVAPMVPLVVDSPPV